MRSSLLRRGGVALQAVNLGVMGLLVGGSLGVEMSGSVSAASPRDNPAAIAAAAPRTEVPRHELPFVPGEQCPQHSDHGSSCEPEQCEMACLHGFGHHLPAPRLRAVRQREQSVRHPLSGGEPASATGSRRFRICGPEQRGPLPVLFVDPDRRREEGLRRPPCPDGEPVDLPAVRAVGRVTDGPDGRSTAGSGAIWSLRSNALRPAGWTSADAAGLPIAPLLVQYAEVRSGTLDHAIRFTADCTQRSYLWPARHEAGQANGDCPRCGAALQAGREFLVAGVRVRGDVPNRDQDDEDLRPHPRRQRQQLVLPRRCQHVVDLHGGRSAEGDPRLAVRGGGRVVPSGESQFRSGIPAGDACLPGSLPLSLSPPVRGLPVGPPGESRVAPRPSTLTRPGAGAGSRYATSGAISPSTPRRARRRQRTERATTGAQRTHWICPGEFA